MTLNDLPEVQITRRVRSTRLRLRIDGQKILLSAPVFCSDAQIQQFIRESESWIVKTWQKYQKQPQAEQVFPEQLKLFDREQPIQISCQSQKKNFEFDSLQGVLMLSDRQPERYLKAFVIDYAKQHLPNFLQQVSKETGLSYHECHIRQPKTRWGSCSARHDIMINSAVVLYPIAVVRYLCVHELAHTRHFDHSPQFWTLVEHYDSEHLLHRKQLRQQPLPYWWYHTT